MKMYTLYALGIGLALLATPALTATPATDGARMDVSDLPVTNYEIDVPAGHALVATITEAGVELSTTPLGAIPVNHAGGSGCIYTAAGVGWVRSGLNSNCNLAAYEAHQAALTSVTLVTTSTGIADAFDVFTWNYWFISCSAPGFIGGSGSCQQSGTLSGFTYWDAQTLGNAATAVLYQ